MIKKLRQLTLKPGQRRLSDNQIGDLFGISRERVAQIAGRKGGRSTLGLEAYDFEIQAGLDAGLTQQEIAAKINRMADAEYTSTHIGTYVRKTRGLYYLSNTHAKRRFARVEARLREFLKYSKRDLTPQFLMAWDGGGSLYKQATSIMPLADWAKHLGIKRTLRVRGVPVVRRKDVIRDPEG